MRKGLLQNEQLYKLFVIPSKTATHWVAVLRGNPSPLIKNGLPRQCAHWRAMTKGGFLALVCYFRNRRISLS